MPLPSEAKTPSAMQRFIAAAVERHKEIGTRYRLAQICGWKESSIYRMLSNPCFLHNAELMLAALGAEVRIGRARIRLRLTERGKVEAKYTAPGEEDQTWR